MRAGGRYDTAPRPGGGTIVEARVPLTPVDEGGEPEGRLAQGG